MSPPADILRDLKQHLDLCHELFAVVEREGQALRGPGKPSLTEFYQSKKTLLPRLDKSLDTLKQNRAEWQKLAPDERARHPEIARLLRQNQDLTMKIILLERENEQCLLRRGLVPPRQLPRAERQRPHFVAELYRRRGGS
jgi:flagellar biosynthesis/type III secretory pathway chaperone